MCVYLYLFLQQSFMAQICTIMTGETILSICLFFLKHTANISLAVHVIS